MQDTESSEQLVLNTLNVYRSAFRDLVASNARACADAGQNTCEFFLDIACFIEGLWNLTPLKEFEHLPEFRTFDWPRLLGLDEVDDSGEAQQAFKAGYLWLVEQLTESNAQLNGIEIRLFLNGSGDYVDLSQDALAS